MAETAADRVNRQAREASERHSAENLADLKRQERATTTPMPIRRERAWPEGQEP